MCVYVIYCMRNTIRRRRGGNNATKRCMDRVYLVQINNMKRNQDARMTKLRKELQRIDQRILKEGQKQKLVEKKTELEHEIASVATMVSSTEKVVKKYFKRTYCNPGCVDTFFEKGTKLPKGVMKQLHKDTQKLFPKSSESAKQRVQAYVKMFRDERKKIFGQKTNVLVDDFYEGIAKEDVKKMKEAGSISGCTTRFIPADFESK